MQDFKFICIVVMICVTMVNGQTHTETDRQLVIGYTISSTS